MLFGVIVCIGIIAASEVLLEFTKTAQSMQIIWLKHVFVAIPVGTVEFT